MKEVPAPTDADSVRGSVYQHPLPEGSWMHNDVNAIVEDKTEKNFGFVVQGVMFIYDVKMIRML